MADPISDDPKILVVDDDPGLRRVLCLALEEQGYSTTFASNGEEALLLVKANTYSAIVTDYDMPRMNGRNLIDHIKTFNTLTPVLLMTAGIPETVFLDLLKYSRFLAIHKPFSPPAFFKALMKVMNSPVPTEVHKRSEFRVKTAIPAQWSAKGPEVTTGILRNLSLGGTFVETEKPIPAGTELDISFQHPTEPSQSVSLKGEVVWAKHGENPGELEGAGVHFRDLDRNTIRTLQTILAQTVNQMGLGWFESAR